MSVLVVSPQQAPSSEAFDLLGELGGSFDWQYSSQIKSDPDHEAIMILDDGQQAAEDAVEAALSECRNRPGLRVGVLKILQPSEKEAKVTSRQKRRDEPASVTTFARSKASKSSTTASTVKDSPMQLFTYQGKVA